MTLSEAWEIRAQEWITWVRKPGHDSYDRNPRDQFLPLIPLPVRRTLDVGCGEGRLTRHLASLGHRVVGIDASPNDSGASNQAGRLGRAANDVFKLAALLQADFDHGDGRHDARTRDAQL